MAKKYIDFDALKKSGKSARDTDFTTVGQKKNRWQRRLWHATQAGKMTGEPAYKWMMRYTKWSGK